MVVLQRFGLLCLAATLVPTLVQSTVTIPRTAVGTAPPLPPGTPHPPPPYMRDNRNNYFRTAPDQGSMDGPILESLDSDTLARIHNNTAMPSDMRSLNSTAANSHLMSRQNADNYWLSTAGGRGRMPLAPSGYQFFRNVRDFGAKGDGVTDDTAAINRAAATYGLLNLNKLRCGKECGSTTTLGAVVYFPPGTYLISTPIIQYYYTQFVGNPTQLPTLKSTFNFTGIAMIDSDVYIPGGNGAEWYINQSNFYRQIRNFNFDLTAQNWTNMDNDQTYNPTGIHWQVGQATSITNCNFNMAVSQGAQRATAVGIYMENGSGGTVADLTFTGGNIGFLAGSQQFTATNLKFTSCLTAIFHQWNWGFTWKNIYVLSCYIAIDATSYSGLTKQGTGSITVLDSHFNGVPYGITVGTQGEERPSIVLDNLLVENSQSVVLVQGGDTVLAGSTGALYFDSWASGYQYLPNGVSGKKTGFMDPKPKKSPILLDSSGAYFYQSKPQYAGTNVVVATSNGVANDATGDQTAAINSLLSKNVGSVIFFPGGIYRVQGTVKVPVGSKIIGSGWSQIMGTGSFFQNVNSPQVMVQVGNPGDSGVVQITDMLFTVSGPTAGAILMEWNIHESSQGSAAMWDSHFRVGGATGSNLQLANCPPGGSAPRKECMAAYMLLHVTTRASGYFDNVWAWVADHDLDNPANAEATEGPDGIPSNVKTNMAVYSARGILIESQGPTWFYGSASEHSQLYQYQLSGAANVYLGCMQTETPYYQPSPNALAPYTPGQVKSDPTFKNCADDECRGAWALRIINSTSVYIYSAGFYSFFKNLQLGCTAQENCQLAMIDTNFASDLWIYSIFTKGNVQIVTPQGGLAPLLFNSTTRNGYTSEIAAWLALSTEGSDIGNNDDGGSGIVTIDPEVWSSGTRSATVQCLPPCTYVFPPLTLSTPTTFTFPLLTTALTVGNYTPTTIINSGTTSTTSIWRISVITTTITIPPVTTSVISWFEETVTNNSTTIYPFPSITQSSWTITDPTSFYSTTITRGTRTFWPPPWPGTNVWPCLTSSCPPGSTDSRSDHGGGGPPVTHTGGPPKPTCRSLLGCGTHCNPLFHACSTCWIDCTGPPGVDGQDPDQPGGITTPGGTPTTQCSTSTYTSCSTGCVPSGATSSCTTSCRDIVGCQNPTDKSACTRDFPMPTNTWQSQPGQHPVLGAGGIYGYVLITAKSKGGGGPSSTAPNPTTTKPTNPPSAYPTNDAIDTGGSLCFNPSDNVHKPFSDAGARQLIEAFCARNLVLRADQVNPFAQRLTFGGISISVSAGWAKNQDNDCGTKKDFPLNQNNFSCKNAWSTDFFQCLQPGSDSISYGGAYVLRTRFRQGCILLSLSADFGL